jgi:hypothetical protein
LTNPALEEWEGDLPATIVIVPQVMRELDRHKLHHPKPDLQEKARKSRSVLQAPRRSRRLTIKARALHNAREVRLPDSAAIKQECVAPECHPAGRL